VTKERRSPGCTARAASNELVEDQSNAPCRGYEDAARHLLDQGLLPAPNLPALRGMWAAGGESRRAAQVIAAAWGFA